MFSGTAVRDSFKSKRRTNLLDLRFNVVVVWYLMFIPLLVLNQQLHW